MDQQQIDAILNSETVQITTHTGRAVMGRPVAYTDRPAFLIERPNGRRELVPIDGPDLRVVNLGRMFRPRGDSCPDCGAPEDRWCREGCGLIDRMDCWSW